MLPTESQIIMKPQPVWWKLYLFAAVACATLFVFPPTNQAFLIIWMVIVFGTIAVWIYNNQSQLAAEPRVKYKRTVITPVAEFMDEDRRYLQALGTEIPDDNLLDNPHEAA